MDQAETILSVFKTNVEEGFQRLYDAYYQSLSLLADSIVNDPDAAEDVVQDFFVDFWINKRYRHVTGGLHNYVFQSVRYSAVRYKKKKEQQGSIYEKMAENLEMEESPVEEYEHNAIERLYSLINRLPQERRNIFLMICVNEMTYQEAADALGISKNTIKTQMTRSLRFLRENLKGTSFLTLLSFLVRKK